MRTHALAAVFSLATLSLPLAASADPARHLQLAVTLGGSFADAHNQRGAHYGAPASATVDVRYFGASDHGFVARASYEHAGFVFATENLTITRAEAGYAWRAPIAGTGPDPWLVGNVFAAGGVALGTAEHDTCGLCLFTNNVATIERFTALSLGVGASIDARVFGASVGLATEIRALPAVEGPSAYMPFSVLVGLRLGLERSFR